MKQTLANRNQWRGVSNSEKALNNSTTNSDDLPHKRVEERPNFTQVHSVWVPEGGWHPLGITKGPPSMVTCAVIAQRGGQQPNSGYPQSKCPSVVHAFQLVLDNLMSL